MSESGKKANIFMTFWIMTASLLATLRVCLVVIIKAAFGAFSRDEVDQLEKTWSQRMLNIVKLKCNVQNPHAFKFIPGKVYIVMSNHAGHYDIPLLLHTLTLDSIKGSIRMIAKKELFQVPIWGKAMQVAEYISVDRKDRKQAIKDLELAKEKMQSGIAIWLAPEGTRSRDGKIQQFKKGGFMLALQTGATIVPIGIRGSQAVLPPDTWKFTTGLTAEVHIGETVDASQYSLNTRDDLMQLVKSRIVKAAGQS